MKKNPSAIKTVQFIAFIMLAFMLAFYAGKVYDSINFGIYGEVDSYQESNAFRSQMNNDVERIAEILSDKKLDNIPSYYGFASNFCFSVYLNDTYLFGNGEEVQYNNVRKETVFDPRLGEQVYYIYYEVNDAYPIDDVYYRQSLTFESLRKSLGLNTAGFVISLLGAVSLCAILAKKEGHHFVEKPLLKAVDAVPLDLLAIIYSMIVAAYFALISVFRNLDASSRLLSWIGFTLAMTLFLILLLSIRRRSSKEKFYLNTFIYRLILALPDFIHHFPFLLKYTAAAVVLLLVIPLVLIRLHPLYGGLYYALYAIILIIFCNHGFVSIYKIRNKANDLMNGRYDEKLDDESLMGVCRSMAEQLNRISDGLNEALQKNISSERLKIELITNVSHDLKTPLTSILNYIDLLKSNPDEAQRNEYLQILDKQANRLKKITDDVLEISKVSSGNIKMECENVNVSQLLYQALGEYEDKMTQRQLQPISNIEENMMAYIDGKHIWRVLDNCLNNVIKYAKPETRVYIDGQSNEKECVITIKNVSEQQLNLSAEALMERFVRGERSRNSEGSGLGLNIAKSLTELQHGQFDIQIDGDLFKIQIRLPKQKHNDSVRK